MLFQINTRVVLGEIAVPLTPQPPLPQRGEGEKRRATLDDLPERLWDELAQRGFRWVWRLGLGQTGPMGRDVPRTFRAWRAGFREVFPDLPQEDVVGSPFAIVSSSCHKDFGGADALARVRERLRKRGLKLM